MRLNQKGFTLIEGSLIVIALALISGVGFYVYNANKQDNKSANSNTSNNSNDDTAQAQKQQEYVEFKDLGFKIKKNDKMSDWSYFTEPEFPMTKIVQSAAHVKKIDECNKGGDSYEQENETPMSKSFMAFSRVEGTYKEGDTLGSSEMIKQFDNFYISASYPNGGSPCFNEKGVGYPVERAPQGAQETMVEALKAAEKI